MAGVSLQTLVAVRQILLCLVAIFGAFLFLGHVPVDSDLWWQLKTGTMLYESGEILSKDPFSFATSARTWINHQWLAQYLLGFLYDHFGNQGFFFLRGFVFVVTLLAFYFSAWLASRNTLVILATTLFFFAPILNFYLNLRPRAFVFLFLTLLVLVHQLARFRSQFAVWAYPLIIILFVNIHGGFVLGFAFVCSSLFSLSLGGDGVDRNFSRKPQLQFGAVFLFSFFSLFLNPYGADLIRFVLSEMGSAHPNITEWQALTPEQIPAYIGIVGLPFMALLFRGSFLQHRTLMIFWIGSSVLAYRYNRFLILCAIFSLLLALSSLPDRVERKWSTVGSWKEVVVLAILFLPVLFLGVNNICRGIEEGQSLKVDVRRYPIQAVEFLKQNMLGPKLGLPFDWGGYAIWHLYPEYLVSIDGRYASAYGNTYSDNQIRGYLEGDLELLQREFSSQVFLVGRSGKLEQRLLGEETWKRVYQDPIASIFIPTNRAQQRKYSVVTESTIPASRNFP